jgi:hypothetical protein
MNARHLSPGVHRPRHSGITLSGQAAVRALLDAIDQTAREGGLDPVRSAIHIVQSWNLAKPLHWAALASLALAPTPDAATQAAVLKALEERV